MPYVFQVLARALIALCTFYIVRLCLMYVDDIMGVSPIKSAASDMKTVDKHVTGLLGPDAIAISKNELARSLVWIGWFVDLNTRSVTLSRRNLLKTIYAFFCFSITNKVTRIQVETMASLASRCSQLCRQMRPYTKALYDTIGLYKDRHIRRTLPALAKVDVAVWRAFLILSRFSPAQLSRPINSFAIRLPTLVFKYDASLLTLAIGVYLRTHDGAPLILLAYTSINLAFPTTEARKQNTFEFLTVSVGILICQTLHISHQSCELQGDSIRSLAWSQRDRADSILARRSNIAYTLAAAHNDITVVNTIHVPGKENVVYDGLTRLRTASDVGLPTHLKLFFPPDHPIHTFPLLCDPDAPLEGYRAHAQLSRQFFICIFHPPMTLPHPIH
jgi:hypothetical protein